MNRMDSTACAKAMAAVVPDGEWLLEEHLRTYEELLLHVYARQLGKYADNGIQQQRAVQQQHVAQRGSSGR